MTIKQLIEELKKFPDDMPVATDHDISWETKDDPQWINVEKCIWEHSNHPYNLPDFDYVNLS